MRLVLFNFPTILFLNCCWGHGCGKLTASPSPPKGVSGSAWRLLTLSKPLLPRLCRGALAYFGTPPYCSGACKAVVQELAMGEIACGQCRMYRNAGQIINFNGGPQIEVQNPTSVHRKDVVLVFWKCSWKTIQPPLYFKILTRKNVLLVFKVSHVWGTLNASCSLIRTGWVFLQFELAEFFFNLRWLNYSAGTFSVDKFNRKF